MNITALHWEYYYQRMFVTVVLKHGNSYTFLVVSGNSQVYSLYIFMNV